MPAPEPSDHERSDHESIDHEPSDHEPSDHESIDQESIDDESIDAIGGDPGVDPEVQQGAAERMVFFSDAVVAIALTLLALELPVPAGASMSDMWAFFTDHAAEYLAFTLSFVVIAIHWTSHHRLFRWIFRMDDRVRFLNFCWLFTIVITPFATNLLSVHVDAPSGADTSQPLRFALYALVQVVGDVVFILIARHMSSARLLRPSTPGELVRRTVSGTAVFAVAFGVSIPLFFVFERAWVLWIAVPVIGGFTAQMRRRTSSRR